MRAQAVWKVALWPLERGQLLAAACRMAGLVSTRSPQGCDLIAAEDERLGVLVRHGLRLRQGETLRTQGRGLIRSVGLGDIRCDHIEGQREPREERAPVGRGRGQDKSAHGREIGHRNKGLDAGRF